MRLKEHPPLSRFCDSCNTAANRHRVEHGVTNCDDILLFWRLPRPGRGYIDGNQHAVADRFKARAADSAIYWGIAIGIPGPMSDA